jgi:hypothetical protein
MLIVHSKLWTMGDIMKMSLDMLHFLSMMAQPDQNVQEEN